MKSAALIIDHRHGRQPTAANQAQAKQWLATAYAPVLIVGKAKILQRERTDRQTMIGYHFS